MQKFDCTKKYRNVQKMDYEISWIMLDVQGFKIGYNVLQNLE